MRDIFLNQDSLTHALWHLRGIPSGRAMAFAGQPIPVMHPESSRWPERLAWLQSSSGVLAGWRSELRRIEIALGRNPQAI